MAAHNAGVSAAAVLLAGGEAGLRREWALLLGEWGYGVRQAVDLKSTIEMLAEERAKVLVWMPTEEEGDDKTASAVREIMAACPLLPVIVTPARRDASRAIELLRLGAWEVLPWPQSQSALKSALARAIRFEGTSLSVAPPPREPSSRAVLWGLTLAALLGLALGVLSVRRAQLRRETASRAAAHWDLPYSHPSSLAFDGGGFWISDWYTRTLNFHRRADMSLARVVPLTRETPIGIGFGGGFLFTSEARGAIARHMKDASFTTLGVYRQDAYDTVGIAYDGLFLWTVSRHTLYKRILDADLSVVESWPYPGRKAAALAFNGESLWSLDSGTGELIRHRLDRPGEAAARVPLPEYKDGNYEPVGLAWDGARFWSVAARRSDGRIGAGAPAARIFRHAAMGIE